MTRLTKLLTHCTLLAAMVSPAGAQQDNKIDLSRQAKNVDFSAAPSTKPSKTGTTLPSTCSVGETYFKTNAAAGSNWYGCTTTNVWTVLGGGSGLPSMSGTNDRLLSNNGATADWRPIGGDLGGSPQALTVSGLRGRSVSATAPANGQALVWNNGASQWEPQNQAGGGSGNATQLQSRALASTAPADGQALVWNSTGSTWQPGAPPAPIAMTSVLGDFKVTRDSGTLLTVGANCSLSTPCTARFGDVATSFTAQATVTLTGGTGMVRIYLDGASSPPVLKVRTSDVTVNCSGMGCLTESGTSFPGDAIPLFAWNATSGAWDATGGTDLRAILSSMRVVGGTGVAVIQATGNTTVAVDSATVPTYLTALATLDFPSIATGACATDLTLTLSGAAANDAVAASWPAGLEAGLIGMMRVSAANTISVRLCNFSGGALNPASGAFRATVVRSF